MTDVANDNKTTDIASIQKQLLMDRATFEQEMARTDRLMRGRSTAFSLAVEALKASGSFKNVDAAIVEASKIEKYLSEGADSFVSAAKALNDLDALEDQLVVDEK